MLSTFSLTPAQLRDLEVRDSLTQMIMLTKSQFDPRNSLTRSHNTPAYFDIIRERNERLPIRKEKPLKDLLECVRITYSLP
jgi:hypothetical protein